VRRRRPVGNAKGGGVSLRSKFAIGGVLLTLAPAASAFVFSGSSAWAGACEAKSAQKFLGKRYTEALRDKARAASHATIVEDLRRGEATTTEFRGDRLDIIIDPKTNAVIGLWCG
jgi:Peptidase inhibitor I78 family